ncbi:MAG TPA: hypothetical protein VNT75_09410 [Symbiobacteriaceae bacterium]|nr:hypothetical protein [Symbiobacteriaceae bacterium]
MPKVLLQSAVLLILGQLILGAVGYVLVDIPWLGLPLGIILFWLILRLARVLRGEMETQAKQNGRVVPWQMALWATLLWQWPSVILLPSGTFAPEWMGKVWNGVMVPVQGTVGLISQTAADGLGPWLWLAVVLEALAFALVVGQPLATRSPVPERKAAQAAAQRQVAASGEWAPARRHREVTRRRNKR